METFLNERVSPEQRSSLALAFIGDTVFDLLVRGHFIKQANYSAERLHCLSRALVNAGAQAAAARAIMPRLTEQELAVLRRGKNARTNHIAKSACDRDYHYATGLEALFGYLYLSGRVQRINELFELILSLTAEGQNLEEKL